MHQLAKSCNKENDEDLMRLIFIGSIENSEAYNMAQALVGLQTLELIAAKLDNSKLGQAEVFAVTKPLGENSDLQKQVGDLARLVEKLSTKVAEVNEKNNQLPQIREPADRIYGNAHNRPQPWHKQWNNRQSFPSNYAPGFTADSNLGNYRSNYNPRPNNGNGHWNENRGEVPNRNQQWRDNGFKQTNMSGPGNRGNASRPPLCFYHATFGVNARRCMQPCFFENSRDPKNLQFQRR